MQKFICKKHIVGKKTVEKIIFANSREEAAEIAECDIKDVQLHTRKH